MSAAATTSSTESVTWIHGSLDPLGRCDYRVGRQGDDLIADWCGWGTLRASRTGDWSEFVAAPGNEEWATKMRSGIVAALLRHLKGEPSLHGAAATLGGAALCCIGDSGAGKSTTIADLCSHGGFALVADDVTALRLDAAAVSVEPTESVHWLHPDAALALGHSGSPERKSPCAARVAATESTRLAAVVHLRFDDTLGAPVLRRLRGQDLFPTLHQAMFRFVVDEPDVQVRDLRALARLAALVPFYELTRAREFNQLGACRRALMSVLGCDATSEGK